MKRRADQVEELYFRRIVEKFPLGELARVDSTVSSWPVVLTRPPG